MTSPSPIQTIVKRDGSLAQYERDRIATAIFLAMTACKHGSRAEAESVAVDVESALVDAYGADALPSVEDIQDLVEETLMAREFGDVARSYIIYRHQRALARAQRNYVLEVTDNIPYRKIYDVLLWNIDNNCCTVQQLNDVVENGGLPDLIRETDRRFDREIETAANEILGRLDDVRLVIIAGPSSSGKTTATIKISERLRSAGVDLKALNVDNYFFDLVQHPKDDYGDYDYETPQALDLALINEHLAKLIAGETVSIPHYNFKTGERTLNVESLALKEGQIILLDSLHGLYADMTSNVPDAAKYKVYVETLGQFRLASGDFMRWADNRLIRRMIRDSHYRNSQPLQTLSHWHYVRRSELTNIIPFIARVDCVVNSALPYELPFLKARMFSVLPGAVEEFRDAPHRQDAYIRAKRIFDLLEPLHAVDDDSMVPSRSLLREFIGGSEHHY